MKTCLVSLCLLAASTSAQAATMQSPCGLRDDIITMLASKYREVPRAMAIANKQLLLEVFTSKSGSWTILLTHPNGAACIVSAGDSWEEIPDPKKFTAL